MISRNSAFVYKGKPINAQSVANELGVQYVVEGSVRRAGSRVRITAQLIDAETDRHLWGRALRPGTRRHLRHPRRGDVSLRPIVHISNQRYSSQKMRRQMFKPHYFAALFWAAAGGLLLGRRQPRGATAVIRALMPPAIQAPTVVQFNASSVPVLQISLSSDTLDEQIYRLRQQLAPIPGITLPTPAGGKYRQIMVDLDPSKLLAKGLTPLDVVNAVNT